MTPLDKLEHSYSATSKLIIAQKYLNNITQRELRKFKKWAVSNGWTISRTYKEESKNRAFTLKKGKYTILGIDRATPEFSERYKHGHRRGDKSIILECNLVCFINGQNLGQFGIHWNDFMAGDEDLLISLRVPLRYQHCH